MRSRILLALAGALLIAPLPALPQQPDENEPPEAQALAERLVATGRGKTVALKPHRTGRLQMRMVRIVDRTRGVAGFRREVERTERSLDDRLRDLNAEVTETEVIVRLPGAILFDFDSTRIRPDAERTLTELVGVLRGFAGRPVRVEGHTDAIASDAYNQRLSEQRAAAVRDWLVAHGSDAGSLRALGHGESRPVADNATASGRQLNRRVEVIIEKRS